MCMDRLSSKERRVGRDREDEHIQYQVRGKFGDDSDEDPDMVPDTRWVKLSELVQKIDEPIGDTEKQIQKKRKHEISERATLKRTQCQVSR